MIFMVFPLFFLCEMPRGAPSRCALRSATTVPVDVVILGYDRPRRSRASVMKNVHGSMIPSPIGSMYAILMVTFTINIAQMLAYIPYMDLIGLVISIVGVPITQK